jgi:phosphate acetyltransferase
MTTLLEEQPVREQQDHEKFRQLVKKAQGHPPAKTAVAHPCDQASLEGATEAARLRLIEPILVGTADKIRSVAAEFGIDLRARLSMPSAAMMPRQRRSPWFARPAGALMKRQPPPAGIMGAVVGRDRFAYGAAGGHASSWTCLVTTSR